MLEHLKYYSFSSFNISESKEEEGRGELQSKSSRSSIYTVSVVVICLSQLFYLKSFSGAQEPLLGGQELHLHLD